MLRCMNTIDNMLLEPQHETSLPPQIPCMVNRFAKLRIERYKCHDLCGHPLRPKVFLPVLLYTAGLVGGVSSGVSCLALVWGRLVGHCCLVFEQQSVTKSASRSLGHLNISSARSRAECDCGSVTALTDRRKKRCVPHQSLTRTCLIMQNP